MGVQRRCPDAVAHVGARVQAARGDQGGSAVRPRGALDVHLGAAREHLSGRATTPNGHLPLRTRPAARDLPVPRTAAARAERQAAEDVLVAVGDDTDGALGRRCSVDQHLDCRQLVRLGRFQGPRRDAQRRGAAGMGRRRAAQGRAQQRRCREDRDQGVNVVMYLGPPGWKEQNMITDHQRHAFVHVEAAV
jgi:hypothetical protein